MAQIVMTPRVFLLQPPEEALRWQTILVRLGVPPCDIKERRAQASLQRQSAQGLLIADRSLLQREIAHSNPSILQWIDQKRAIVVTGPSSSDGFPFPVEELGETRDPIVINDLLLRHVANYSRHLPRIDTQLPGIFTAEQKQHFCEISNLGPGGAFVKTGTTPPSVGSDVRLHIALLGLRKEVELEAQIVRQIIPHEQNNYQQGFGVQFSAGRDVPTELLHAYVNNVISNDDILHHSQRSHEATFDHDDKERPTSPLPTAVRKIKNRTNGHTIRHT